MRLQSVLTPQQQFAKVASPMVQRSTFNRSHGYKTTFDAGQLIPFYVDEALPADTINMNCTVFGRLATPLKPFMDNMFIDVHFFSVPMRLVWDNWEKFNGEQDNPADSTDFIHATIDAPAGGFTQESIYDYMGIPTKVDNISVRADFLRAYNLIWNEWYRDENLQDSAFTRTNDSGGNSTNYFILPRGKRKDYFTSALPFAQKADPVSIPLGTQAPVAFDSATPVTILAQNSNGDNVRLDSSGSTLNSSSTIGSGSDQPLYADLSTATAVTINALRQSFQIQVMYELDARGGTRYTETIKTHFGVTSLDARLQRPEFLGGYSARVNVNPIANTSGTASENQGDLAGIGTFTNSGKGFIKSFTEHEIVIGLVSARADLNYQQGLDRMWSRSTRFDHFWPSLANLGEQAILNKEIFAQGTGDDDLVFGYQERYSEYKYKPSKVTSKFRSNHTGSLDIWHLSQDFASLPVLGDTFIQEDPPVDRVIAVPSEPHFIMDAFFDLKHTRPMQVYNTPYSLSKL